MVNWEEYKHNRRFKFI